MGLSFGISCRERLASMNRERLPLMTVVLCSGSYIAGKYTTLELGPLTTTLLCYFSLSNAIAPASSCCN